MLRFVLQSTRLGARSAPGTNLFFALANRETTTQRNRQGNTAKETKAEAGPGAGGWRATPRRKGEHFWVDNEAPFLPSLRTLRRDGLGACEAEESKESSEAVCSDLYCENALMAAMTTYTLTVAAAAARYYRQLATTLAILYRVITYCVPIVAQTSRQTRHAGHHTPALDINAGEQTIPDRPTD